MKQTADIDGNLVKFHYLPWHLQPTSQTNGEIIAIFVFDPT